MQHQQDAQRTLKGRERALQDPRFGDTRWSPAGFIFIVTEKDCQEQLRTLLFGWPANAWSVVQKIIIGTPIFLFDIHHQVFHGIFTAITPGTLNLDPLAFGGSHHAGSPFPSQVRCEYHYKYSPTPRWLFQKVPGLFYDGTLKINRLLKEEQVQKMYDIFNTNHFKIMRNLAAVNPNTAPAALPFPMDIEPAEAGQWQEPGSSSQHPNSHPPLPWDAPPKGPKPFGVLHETYSEVRPQRFPSVPHHRVDRVQTEYNTKARKLHDRADDGRNTTVMLANIPDGLIADDCIDSLDQAGFFASYDYFIFRPTFQAPKNTRFGSLIINMTSREAAEAVFDEVDRITARWPPFQYPYPQVPVRWAVRQGLEELEAAHGGFGFRLRGLPSAWAIPDEKHIFFELPGDPHGVLERQEAQMHRRAHPDEQAWESAYQNGLEAGLDEDVGMQIAVPTEQQAFSSMPEELPMPHAGVLPLPPPQKAGMNPMLQSSDLPLPPPPPPTSGRGISSKRPAHDNQSTEASKRQKADPGKAHKTSGAETFREKSRQLPPLSQQTAEELRKADIERRLNSALSHKSSKAEKFPAPEKHSVRSKQNGPQPERLHHSPEKRKHTADKEAQHIVVDHKRDGLAHRDHSTAARQRPPIPVFERVATSTHGSPLSKAVKQSRPSGKPSGSSPPESGRTPLLDAQPRQASAKLPDQSTEHLEGGEARKDPLSQGSGLDAVGLPAEPDSQAGATASNAAATASPAKDAPAEVASSRAEAVSQPERKPIAVETNPKSDIQSEPPELEKAESKLQKAEKASGKTPNFDFGANFVSLF